MVRSLPFKLYTGLGIAALLVLLVGFITVDSLNRQAKQAEFIQHTHKAISYVRDVRYNIMLIRGSRRSYWVTGDRKAIVSLEKGTSFIPNRLNELREFVRDDAAQVKNVMRLDSLAARMLSYWNNEGKIVVGMPVESFKKILTTEEMLLEEIYKQIELVKLEEEARLIERENTALQYGNRTRLILYIGISVLLIVVLMLINAVIQTLKSRYKAGLRLQATLDETEKVNKMAQEKNWVLEGMSYINNRLQVVDSTSVLAERIILSLVQYLELPAGVIYFVDEKNNRIYTAASVAVAASSSKSFIIGEGIVGNAALSKTISIIRNIPADYWKVESSLGQVTGNGEIACVPLWMNDELKGLIELGCFVSFSELQVALLKSIPEILSAAINSYQSRDKINQLLDELQEQKEALMEQQEELRQANDELSRQTEELQASEEELKTQEEELKQINLELKARNETIEDARRALSLKARELENTSRYKSEFLANMSHELRTPLNSVLILAKLLADNNKGNLNTKQVEYAHIIHKSGKDLLQLINDILDLSKIEAGKIDLAIEKVELSAIASDIKQLFAVVASDKGIHFNIKVAQNLPAFVQTDKQRIEQVIRNLLSNAFKFTPKEGSIDLDFSSHATANGEMLGISVSDTGIGISKEKQQLIFEAFQQADGSTSRKYGGTGLGLSISKELVRLLGGSIDVSSEDGKGSKFTIYIPYEHQVPPPVMEEKAMDDNTSILSIADIREQNFIEDDRPSVKPGDRVMLIIEDDVNFATIIKDFARHKGYKVILALQGDEGLYYAQRYKPTAIILDIQLPVMDGWTILKKIRADVSLRHTPVHIISAFDDKRFKNADVMSYLRKPIDAATLERAFNSLGDHIRSGSKNILIVSSVHFEEDGLHHLAAEKHYQLHFEQVTTVADTISRISDQQYDCLIVHIGENIQLPQAQEISKELESRNIPVIIHLDEDIGAENELHLRKISDIIIHSAMSANNRLLDELELFLHKMREADRKPEIKNLADTTLTDKKILVVDDDMRNVFALSAVLESNQMKVVAASDGKEALLQLKNTPDIDLVLMDIMMPEMDGYEAMQRIRNDLRLTKLPIIALTAKAMAGDRDKCIFAGASDYITKPVDMPKLFSMMRVWLTK